MNQDNNSVSVFNAATNAKLAEIAVGAGPRTLAVAPNGSVWVTNKHAATISVIDPSTLTVSQTLALPFASQPFGIAFAPTGGFAFVALEAKRHAAQARCGHRRHRRAPLSVGRIRATFR